MVQACQRLRRHAVARGCSSWGATATLFTGEHDHRKPSLDHRGILRAGGRAASPSDEVLYGWNDLLGLEHGGENRPFQDERSTLTLSSGDRAWHLALEGPDHGAQPHERGRIQNRSADRARHSAGRLEDAVRANDRTSCATAEPRRQNHSFIEVNLHDLQQCP